MVDDWKIKPDRQCTFIIALRHVHTTTVAVKK
jgi:hypothetical protein